MADGTRLPLFSWTTLIPLVTAVAAPQPAPLTLELPGAITVRVPVGFDEDTLGRVLRVARAAT